MVRIDKFEYGEVRYVDCLDETYGLPSLKDKSFDLCLTDPPYNVKFKGKLKLKKEIIYNDNIKNYDKWCELWFKELKRICNIIILTPGNQNLRMWFLLEKPTDFFIHYKKNCCGSTYLAHNTMWEPILFFGKYKNWSYGKKPFSYNVFEILRETYNFIHPCPKSYELWERLIIGMNPISVIDPFIGSGTTAEVCTKLGIPFLGYEIKEEYKHDIDLRLKNCKKEPQQVSVLRYTKENKN